jgi:hypothetical protein
MPRALAVLCLCWALPALATPPLEVQLALESLRSGERARLEKARGPAERLPLYRVQLDVEPARRTVSGRVLLTLTPTRRLAEVHLRLAPNAAHPGAVAVSGVALDGARAVVAVSEVERSLLRLRFSPALEPGVPATLSFTLAAQVPSLIEQPGLAALSGSGGASRGDYGAFSASEDVVGLAGIVPMLSPVKADGTPAEGPSGIGDLGTFDPSNFVLSVTAPAGWRALAPGVLSGELPEPSGRQRFTYALAAARELPVLVARGYVSARKQVGEVTVECWHSRDTSGTGPARALDAAASALGLLEAHLGPSPYKSLRVVEARFQGGAGGMEFPGLVTISRALLRGSVDPLAALGLGDLGLGSGALADDAALGQLLGGLGPALSELLDATLEFTVDHEVAHQYFAVLVGNDAILEPVVDEALAQHVALLLREWRHGRKAADALRDAQLKAAYQLHRLMGGPDAAANRPTWAFDSTVEYAALVYGKAPLLFDAWRERLGSEAWLGVLRAYVEQHRYRWATSATLLEVARRRRPQDGPALAELQRHWWDERHGDEDLGVALGGAASGLTGAVPGVDPRVLEAYEDALRQLMGE